VGVTHILQFERFRIITDCINQNNSATVSHLSLMLKQSKATIRRDLNALAELNQIMLTRGGAVMIPSQTNTEPLLQERKVLHTEEKNRIARAALQMIDPGEIILLDSGTTIQALGTLVGDIPNITVATNDLYIANALANSKNVDLTVIGGKLRQGYYNLTGYFTQMILNEIRADKAFIGVDGVDAKFGFMNYNMEEIPVKKLMIEQAKAAIVLCDHSKFESVGLIHICKFDKIDKIITGKEIDQEILNSIKQLGIDIVTV